MVWPLAGLLGSVAGCHSSPPEQPAAPASSAAVVVVPAGEELPTAVPTASAESAAPADSSGKADAPVDSSKELRLLVEIAPTEPPCTIVFRGGLPTADNSSRWMYGIDRIWVEESPTCAAAVVFDLETALATEPDDVFAALEGGWVPKTDDRAGLVATADPDRGPPLLHDMNFDGALDIDVVQTAGAYNQSHVYWLFDPESRTFVRNRKLSGLIGPTFDLAKQEIRAGGRIGGSAYVDGRYQWIAGKLEAMSEEVTHLGVNPKGDPLPPGHSRYVTRHERRGGKLVEEFRGPVKGTVP